MMYLAVLQGDSGMATASGVNALLVPTSATSAMTQVHALSPDGRCKAFGAEADGYGRGEGYAAVVLEPAAASSSRALALFAGSAVNQDGRSSGLTAPHGPSQQALVMLAMREAGAAALEYVATHGTGEVAAVHTDSADCPAVQLITLSRVRPASHASAVATCCPLQAPLWVTQLRRAPCARQWLAPASPQAPSRRGQGTWRAPPAWRACCWAMWR